MIKHCVCYSVDCGLTVEKQKVIWKPKQRPKYKKTTYLAEVPRINQNGMRGGHRMK